VQAPPRLALVTTALALGEQKVEPPGEVRVERGDPQLLRELFVGQPLHLARRDRRLCRSSHAVSVPRSPVSRNQWRP
jgi:hypothetical protein